MLVLAQSVYDDLIAHALVGAPEEVCGVLGGEYGDERSRVDRTLRAENAAPDPRTTYELDPEEQLSLMRAVEDGGDDVVGFYHSHPAGPPRPSRTDVREATWEGYTHVIVALDGEHPYVDAWRWTGETFEQEVVSVRADGDRDGSAA